MRSRCNPTPSCAGPGYRIYFTQRGRTLLLLLCGGDKATQARDITKAHHILTDLGKE